MSIHWIAAAALSTALLAACSSSSDTVAPAAPAVDTAAAAKAALEAKANKDLALYEQMRSNQNWDLAGPLGAELVSKYPDSAAAAQVKQTLADVQAKGREQAEAKRLARLWAYSVSAEPGGTQYAASIESKQPISQGLSAKDTKRAHLILRQHPQWGQNVYIYLDNERFDCRSGCPSLPVSFDGETPKPMKATIPPTGEPSLFIDDDKVFIAKILKSKRVAIDVVLKSAGKKTLVFETGGLDLTHLPGATKAAPAAKKKQ
jgi:outer membrane murein-binding lipoprotein Lpp